MATKTLEQIEARREQQRLYRIANRARTNARMVLYGAAHKSEVAARGAAWRAANKERKTATDRAWYAANKARALAKVAEWKAANKDKDAAYKIAWRIANKDRRKELLREWMAANKERSRLQQKAWREANKERKAATTAAWVHANKEHVASLNRNRRALLLGAEGKHTRSEVKALAVLQRFRCANPKCRCSIKQGYHADHIIPLALGGSNWIRNIQLLCPFCNISKRDKHPIDWARKNGFLL